MRRLALAMLTIGLAAAPVQAQQVDVNAGGAFGHVALTTGFSSPYKITLPAGGDISAGDVAAGCSGFIGDRAVYSLDLSAGAQALFIAAVAAEDTTLVIRAPDGSWHCDDDGFGDRNPLVRIDAPRTGRYQIFIGVYSQATGAPNTELEISEGSPPPKDDGSDQFELH